MQANDMATTVNNWNTPGASDPGSYTGAPRKTLSTAVTFSIREIPSWSLRRRFAGGGIDHGGLLHQLHSPSDEL